MLQRPVSAKAGMFVLTCRTGKDQVLNPNSLNHYRLQTMQHKKIILASRSPRRVELLAQLGVQCEIAPADIDESALAGEDPALYVQRLAKAKALAIAATRTGPALPILAADTTVALGQEILGKPADAAEALAMLSRLSGSVHLVHTAVAVYQGGAVQCLLSTTQVEMMPVPTHVLQDYVASGEPMDKAGAYGIQGRAGAWIARIDGSYSGVMGLPLHETAQLLHAW
jgi:septum formation protein